MRGIGLVFEFCDNRPMKRRRHAGDATAAIEGNPDLKNHRQLRVEISTKARCPFDNQILHQV
jgi:hypothetical protein